MCYRKGAEQSESALSSGRMRRYVVAVVSASYGGFARLHGASVAVYVGVATLVGADLFALIVASAAIWPIGIPLLLATLGLIYYARRILRRRRHDDRSRQQRAAEAKE